MAIVLDGTTGITTPAEAVAGNLSYTGTLTGGAGVINLGSGQVYKDASGNMGIGTSSPTNRLQLSSTGNPGLVFDGTNQGTDLKRIRIVTQIAAAGDFAIQSMNDAGSVKSTNLYIDSSGNLLVGTTSGNGRVHVKGASATSSDHSIFCVNSSASTSFSVRNDGYINTGLLAVSPYNYSATGRAAILDSAGGFGYLASVRAAKTNIENLSDISWAYNLNPVKFNYRKKDENNQFTDAFEAEKYYGLIAEEVEQVNKELCFYDNDGTLRGVSYDKLTSVLLKAIQEQQAIITALTTRITALEAK